MRDERLALLRRAMAGDQVVAAQLLQSYTPLLWYAVETVLRRYGRGAAAVDGRDLFQEAAAQFLHLIQDYRPEAGAPFGLYVKHRLTWYLTNLLREEGHKATVERPLDDRVLRQAEEELATPRDEAEVGLVSSLLSTAIHQLPGRQRVALILHHLDGWSIGQVARRLGIGSSEARRLLRRAEARVRASLDED